MPPVFTAAEHGDTTENLMVSIGCVLITIGVTLIALQRHLWMIILGQLILISGVRWMFQMATAREWHHGNEVMTVDDKRADS